MTAASSTEIPRVTAGNGSFLVVWQERATTFDVMAARIDTTGAVLDSTPLRVASTPADQYEPHATWDGAQWIVGWLDFRGPDGDVCLARVLPDGRLPDDGGVSITGPAMQIRPALAAIGGQLFVAYPHERALNALDLYLTRVSTDAGLVVLNGLGTPIAIGGMNNYPRMATDGRQLLLTWTREDVGVTDRAVRAVRLALDGTVRDLPALDLISSPAVRIPPRVAALSPGEFRVTYARDELDGVPRVFTVGIRARPLGAACDAGADCDGVSCVDGVCCEDACGGGVATDCMACGAAGRCAVVTDLRVCRAAMNGCDLIERCDGVSLTCPMDEQMPMCMPDAGMPDAGTSDAGISDAGTSDGGRPDGGAPGDGGVPLKPLQGWQVCSQGAGLPWVLWALWLLRVKPRGHREARRVRR
jgi:hypothetical protein